MAKMKKKKKKKTPNLLSCINGVFGNCLPFKKDEPAVSYKRFDDFYEEPIDRSRKDSGYDSPGTPTSPDGIQTFPGHWDIPDIKRYDRGVKGSREPHRERLIPGIVNYGHGDEEFAEVFGKELNARDKPEPVKSEARHPIMRGYSSSDGLPPSLPRLNFVDNHFAPVPKTELVTTDVGGGWSNVEEVIVPTSKGRGKNRPEFPTKNRAYGDIGPSSLARKFRRLTSRSTRKMQPKHDDVFDVIESSIEFSSRYSFVIEGVHIKC
ncbi:hypothetical protein FOL47_007081 [Perkinsus chesapeaki]|uniref:Uncharacterized protein n=1 Tax=Perkinsus chesapeaki TaxID=330153 RepID=A0A7J6LMR9_PERCH|nr:hypothetical protein FOL47_007081 [Perkinsus chesapeaki]